MSLFIRFAGLAAGLLACSASIAMAQNVPSECRIIEERSDGLLVAECPTAQGLRASAIRPAECRSTLTARDGVLACSGTTAMVGPLRANEQQQGPLGAFLASVLGTPQPERAEMDMAWTQGSQPLGQRRADLDARIDAGRRDGSLSSNEAAQLTRDHETLVRLEAQYAGDGRFTEAERNDLAVRYAAISDRVGSQRRDEWGYDVGDATGPWQPMTERTANFDSRVLAARNARVITVAQANQLRTDWQGLMRLEADYRRNGIDAREATDLENRMAGMEARLGRFGQSAQSGFGQSARYMGASSWAEIENRISSAERAGSLNRAQLERLRTEHGDLVRLDSAWRRDGQGRLNRRQLSAAEQNYISGRYKEISARIDQMIRRR
jgi:hypothetical protein